MAQIEKNLQTARTSRDAKFAEKVQRMILPAPLKKTSR